MTRTMGSHQSARMKSDVWLTPPHVLEALGGADSFAIDPCAAPEPRPWPTARRMISLPDDGLATDWGAGRAWVNPPYGTEAIAWLRRLAEHGHGTSLTYARTETRWFKEAIWERATAILFLDRRLTFHRADGVKAEANGGAPPVLAAYGMEDAVRLAQSGLNGAFVSSWRVA